MLRVGLTGGIGSGKSFVGEVFMSLGVPVYEADVEAKRLMVEDDELVSGIKKLIGNEAYSSGKINRKYIASKVFNNKGLLAGLNEIVHPAVGRDFENWAMGQTGSRYVIEEAAILFESGASERMDYSIVVHADEEVRLRRVMERDGVSEAEVRARMANQLSGDELIKMADFIIYNENDRLILPQIVDLHSKILKVGYKDGEIW